ncbi:receptor-type tyrosine-protein phosphatase gamma, partial [Oryzias melastigma]|uniref:receptor-type tyrosine-protein phosphatase gamma n=1 Tax=Oryzias melastigma TaxID=30732 RepID=UPI00168D07E4
MVWSGVPWRIDQWIKSSASLSFTVCALLLPQQHILVPETSHVDVESLFWVSPSHHPPPPKKAPTAPIESWVPNLRAKSRNRPNAKTRSPAGYWRHIPRSADPRSSEQTRQGHPGVRGVTRRDPEPSVSVRQPGSETALSANKSNADVHVMGNALMLIGTDNIIKRKAWHPANTDEAVVVGDQPLLTGGSHSGITGVMRERRTAGDPYWSYSGSHGPRGWATLYPECAAKNQSPVDVVDEKSLPSDEYLELVMDRFNVDSSNQTTMKNTGKTVAVLLKDDYFVRGAGLPGRFKAEKMEFHWGQSSGSAGSEHSINGKRFPVEMQIYLYNSDDFDSLTAAIKERRIIAAMAVFFELGQKDNPAVEPIIQGLKGVVHHEKETYLRPFILRDLLPSSVDSYYRYTGSLTT